MSGAGVGQTFLCEGRMNSDTYIDMLDKVLVPSVRKIYDTRRNLRYIYQQDNAPCHKAKKTMEYFKKKNICVLDWPAQSPDLNPIENLWTHLKNEIPQHNPKRKSDLFEFVQLEWEKIKASKCEALVRSMPKRCLAVIKAKGGPIKY